MSNSVDHVPGPEQPKPSEPAPNPFDDIGLDLLDGSGFEDEDADPDFEEAE